MTGPTRRGLLAGAAGGLAALAGCSVLGEGLVDSSLEMRDPRRVRATRPTVVGFDPKRGVVRVTGFMFYGSSSCDRIALQSAEYDGETLRARVGVGDRGLFGLPIPALGCTADMAGSFYVATFRFRGDLPERVVVREGRGDDPERRVVDRAEQRRLCSSDLEDGSRLAERAHWTCPEQYVAADVSEGVE